MGMSNKIVGEISGRKNLRLSYKKDQFSEFSAYEPSYKDELFMLSYTTYLIFNLKSTRKRLNITFDTKY